MKFIASVFLSLFIATSIFAEVKIDIKNRVKNFEPGYCAWVSLETLGRHHEVPKLYDLAKKRSKESTVQRFNGKEWEPLPMITVSYGKNYSGPWVSEKRNVGTDWGIYYRLTELGVKHRMQWSFNKSDVIIKYAIKNDLGCLFGVKEGCFGKGSSAHILILTEYTDKIVEYIDLNDPENIYEATREWFDYWWYGLIVVIERQ